ncbi:hypothetical protein TPHA_0F01820 [Tetrapisispora phaffii CBS 4417]|uniref:Uncharacterized protein n=1 Tax=Tetrapisispora phaffii (strain ATCC 24235 / CBS 4417 / NBRC 1672 / NRRL Y-8282 / UCD 70-5) TaxID=1071381 RepID=G8BV83_TETPH|nr:hypothetical protein TPHA_0F01820 [Tetrapisispora phaffii CBS 4417]CCE63665.1 hypothetical protein TPHA_0F01820 [Tetrapisispora phaffii CBS 4417]
MKPNRPLFAQLSNTIYNTKQTFKNDNKPNLVTSFQYYYSLQFNKLNLGDNTSIGMIKNISYNTNFKRYIRKEWDLLSTTSKRLYTALYIYDNNINYKSLNAFELAKMMEIETPVSSEYMLFRCNFKKHFELINNEQKGNSMKRTIINRYHVSLQKRILGVRRNSGIKINKYIQSENKNISRTYQEFCRECRKVWKENVSELMKEQLREKLNTQTIKFESVIEKERDILEMNLNRISNILSKSKDTQVDFYKLKEERPDQLSKDLKFTLAYLKKV